MRFFAYDELVLGKEILIFLTLSLEFGANMCSGALAGELNIPSDSLAGAKRPLLLLFDKGERLDLSVATKSILRYWLLLDTLLLLLQSFVSVKKGALVGIRILGIVVKIHHLLVCYLRVGELVRSTPLSANIILSDLEFS